MPGMSKPEAERLCFNYAYCMIFIEELIETVPISELMTNPDCDQPLNATRAKSLEILFRISERFSRFGANIDLSKGGHEFICPPIPSQYLVDANIITDPNHIDQIMKRREAREKRKKGPPENLIIVKALEPDEISQLPESIPTQLKTDSPIIRMRERFTKTDPGDSTYEITRERDFIIGQVADPVNPNHYEAFFAQETTTEHTHVYVKGGWVRLDYQNLPGAFSPPIKTTIEELKPITNKQIATLLALYLFPAIEKLKKS
jgi:hypothetical protein